MNPPAGTARFVRPDTDVEDVQARVDTRAADQSGRHQGHQPPGAGRGPLGERAAQQRDLQHVCEPAARLNDDARVSAYLVEAENFESIHNHSAYACIERVKDACGAAHSQAPRLRARMKIS
jgi:hypothetical protein